MSLKISRILHAGYVFECEKTQIAFDPIFENPFSRNCYAFPSVRFDHDQIKNLKLDAVFISHFHDDHCSLESLDLLDRDTPIYLYCVFEEMFLMIRELGFKNVHSLKIDKPIRVGSFEIIPRRALDADVDSIFQIKAAGLNILNVVDSWIDTSTLKQLEQNAPWDMVLWPFQTMREIEVLAPSRVTPLAETLPIEWVEQLKILNPRYVVPSSCQFVQESWSWYNHALFPISYRQFQHEIESILPNALVVRLNPSVSVVLDQNSIDISSALSWIQPVGEQNIDYDYRPESTPPSTSEVAQRFAPLTNQQTDRVYQYCRSDLLEKYQSLELSEERFFQQPQLWRLSIYDHRGDVTHFFYQLNGKKIKASHETSFSWSTEVSIAKLYSALEEGESLTSMYMRMNDVSSVDVVEDPLIRCLFSGSVGSYQAAQLKRLKK